MLKEKLTKYFLPAALTLIVITGCGKSTNTVNTGILHSILHDRESFYYINVNEYPQRDKKLPIGVFDSGTGGLTVLDAIVNFDKHNNPDKTVNENGDNIKDFVNENFIYLGDNANMPYGEYSSHDKTELLKEHIYKDVQFLLGNKYYENASDDEANTDKSPVKAIVIACNTATAYGKDDIEKFIADAGLDIKVIGVIGAGVRGALQTINKDEDASIAVMATLGTVCSDGYPNTLQSEMNRLGFTGSVDVFQQSGIGLAGAIDGSIDFIDRLAEEPRGQYKGPSVKHADAYLDTIILKRFGFDWSNNKMLFDGTETNPENIQINSIENYISYHVVSLMEQVRKNENRKPLKSVILGCTHYPFFTELFHKKFSELFNYRENGNYIYRPFMKEKIDLIDPAVTAAIELYEHLNTNDMFNDSDISKSEFFISIPNIHNLNIVTDNKGNFTYDYKYGRSAGIIQEYVKVVPFSKSTLGKDVIERLSRSIPYTFELIHKFNTGNAKTKSLEDKERI